MDASQSPRRRLRLWQLIAGSLLALVIVLVAVAFVMRASGAAELKRTIADLTARGYPMTVETLRAGAVEGDSLVQGAYDRWRTARAGKKSTSGESFTDPTLYDWIDRSDPVAQRLRDLVGLHAAEFADLRQAIRTGRLHVGTKWIPLIEGKADPGPDLATLRQSADFLRASALAGDPLAFSDLIALVDGMRPTRGSHDSMIASALATKVDQTLVELEVLGRLTGLAADDWVTRRPNLRIQHAEALRWELGLIAFYIGADEDDLGAPGASVSPFAQLAWFASMPSRCRDWIFQASDTAAGFQAHAGLADHLLDPARPMAVPSSISLSVSRGFIAQRLGPILETILSVEAECRSRHVSVLIRREAIHQGSLPPDNADVFADKECGGWLEGGESAYWLAYERLSPTRFRVAVDLRRPPPAILAGLPQGPDFDAAKPLAIIRSAFGQPASKALRLSLKGANTEIVVPDFPPKAVPPVPVPTKPTK